MRARQHELRRIPERLIRPRHGDSPLLQTTDQPTGSIHTGEFATQHRRAYEFPVDAPPDRIREQLRAEVEDNLRDICGNWPTGEFDRIVADVTATAMKYHGRERRQTSTGSNSIASSIPGATTAISLATSAIHSLQRFLRMETLPFG